MQESKTTFRSIFKRKDKRASSEMKSPMFKSPSHYWSATNNTFLHSKGSAHVELSIDPFNKSLIRIFCQSIDKMVNYKSMDYSPRTTVQQVIDKMLKVLRIDGKNEIYVLCEVIGRSMAVSNDGSTTKRLAKNNERSIFIEQNRRLLMPQDYILTVLNYWKPMVGFSRRFDLCLAAKAQNMLAVDESTDSFAIFNDSLSSTSPKLSLKTVNNSTQTDNIANNNFGPPVVPRRKSSSKIILKAPQLVLLKGDNKETPPFFNIIEDILTFGTQGSSCKCILTRIKNFPNKTLLEINKIKEDNQKSLHHFPYRIYVNSVDYLKDYPILLNGYQISDKTSMKPGDILEIGKEYAFFFKDTNLIEDNLTKINYFLNSSTVGAVDTKDEVSSISDVSDNHISKTSTASSLSSSSLSSKPPRKSVQSQFSQKTPPIVPRKPLKTTVDASGITLKCFDAALNQIIYHYIEDSMDLEYCTAFLVYLVKFCRESSRCNFTLNEMRDQIVTRFNSALLRAYDNNIYFVANLKVVSLLYQLWLVYHYDDSSASDNNTISKNNNKSLQLDANQNSVFEENRVLLDFLENYIMDLFDQLAGYVCELCIDMSTCIIEEEPFSYPQQRLRNGSSHSRDGDSNSNLSNDDKTMQKFLDFLRQIFADIDKIYAAHHYEDRTYTSAGLTGEASTGASIVSIIKQVLTSRIVICVTESFLTTLLSEMDSYTWHKGIGIITQLDKFETWLKDEGLSTIYERDGILADFSKLMSLKDRIIHQMDWSTIRRQHPHIPISVLRQYLMGLAHTNTDVLQLWQPIRSEMKEACFDVNVILQEYLQTIDTYTLFHPGIVLQIDCYPIYRIVDSADFVSLATRLDTELNGMTETFRWMTLTRPNSLVNIKRQHSNWLKTNTAKAAGRSNAPRGSMTNIVFSPPLSNSYKANLSTRSTLNISARSQSNHNLLFLPPTVSSSATPSADMVAPSRKTIDKLKKRSHNDSDYSSSSHPQLRPDANNTSSSTEHYETHSNASQRYSRPPSSGNPLNSARHLNGKFSRSLANLSSVEDFNLARYTEDIAIDGGGTSISEVPVAPCRRQRSIMSCASHRLDKYKSQPRRGSASTPNGQLGDESDEEKCNNDDRDDDVINDVDKSIEMMERDIQRANQMEEDRQLEDDEEDFDEEDMSVGLSAQGLSWRMNNRGQRGSSSSGGGGGGGGGTRRINKLIDDNPTVEVVLNKEEGASYGLTIVDGMQTDLKTEGIFVYRLARDSPVYKSQSIRPGDKILSINGYPVDNLSFQECMLLITKSRRQVTLVLEKSNLDTSMRMMSFYQ